LREDLLTFAAHASHPDLGDEVAEGRIVINRWQVRFESETVTLEFPITRVQIEITDPQTGQLGFSEPAQPGWFVGTFDQKILTHPTLLQQAHTRHQIRELKSQGELQRRLKIAFGFLAVFALIAILVSTFTGIMVRILVARVPQKWENELGDKWLLELKQETTFIQDSNMMAKLDRGVAPLIAAIPDKATKYTFYLINEPWPNAFALPGGHVVVTTGLIELADRPEELAGVVAHEIAHVTQKHVFRKVISSYGPYLLVRLFLRDEDGLLGILGEGSQLLVSQSFSQEYELEADSVGWQYLIAAHIDPRGAIDILTKLKAEQAGMSGMDKALRAFDSHPATEKRIQKLEEKWKKLKDKSSFVPLDKE
jgi:predicted Zn-dependent protease